MKETNRKIFKYSNEDLTVAHIFTGLITDAFKVLQNKSDLSDEKIANILNAAWYGRENKLKFRTYISHRKKIVVIKRSYFPKCEV